MRTIMIKDTVYRKLAVFKKDKSFSEVLDELVEASKAAKLERLKKYFGVISDKEARAMNAAAKRLRKELVVRL